MLNMIISGAVVILMLRGELDAAEARRRLSDASGDLHAIFAMLGRP